MIPRIRLNKSEYDLITSLRSGDKDTYRLLIASDLHGWLCDLEALGLVCDVLKDNHFDEVVLNGDIGDFPYISRHPKKLNHEFFRDYTEVKEIEYIKNQILRPLRLSTKADIRMRLGNHDERITHIISQTKEQLERINELRKHYKTTEFDQMLGLKELDIIYDPKPRHWYFDFFVLVHGNSLSKNASEKNLNKFFRSGSSGHSHRLGSFYKTDAEEAHVWFESGCLRTTKNVEYLVTGDAANHQQGFVVITFYKSKNGWRFFGNTYPIIDGICHYNNKIYS